MKARGAHKPGVMNKTEAEYALMLDSWVRGGLIQWYKFEGITMKLADDTRYTPDFFVMDSQGFLECHEVKGYWQDDAKVKIKVAASIFPFKFIAVFKKAKKDGGGWETKTF